MASNACSGEDAGTVARSGKTTTASKHANSTTWRKLRSRFDMLLSGFPALVRQSPNRTLDMSRCASWPCGEWSERSDVSLSRSRDVTDCLLARQRRLKKKTPHGAGLRRYRYPAHQIGTPSCGERWVPFG